MFERFRNDAARPIQQLSESRFTRQIGSQHEGIDEQANEIFGLDLIAPGDLRAHGDVCGAGIAMQQRDQSGVRQHEQRAAILAGDLASLSVRSRSKQLRLDRPGGSLR